MSKQQDLFNPTQKNGKSLYWNKFYKKNLEEAKIRKEKQNKPQPYEEILIKQFIK